MKVVLISMPDVVPLIIHESAIHMPSHGISSIAGNIDSEHDVTIIDLIRKRRSIKKYLSKILTRIQPELVGLSAMAWQYDTCIKIARLVKRILPNVKIVIGGYHATLMYEEISSATESKFVDFIVRGEGEEVCRRLVNALDGRDNLTDIPSLSFKENNQFVHNPRGENLDLGTLKLPVRDKRRLTWGYHITYNKIEVLETSRGCTRTCNFCSMKHMYGRSFRAFPIKRVLEDLDDIYYKRKTNWAFIVDDNMVLDQNRVIELCDAIIARKYKNLNLVVQADCVSMSRNEPMVKKMSEAGFRSVFLGIENASKKNLTTAGKGDICNASRRAIENCHKYGMMVVGGLIFGFPDDDEDSIIENYEFVKSIKADTAYCQILTPYPKTAMREFLLDEGLVTNKTNFTKYNGLWANVKTKHLDSARLQYLFWYHRQTVLGWWNPSKNAQKHGKGWTSIWRFIFKPVMKLYYGRMLKKHGWEGRYQKEVGRWTRMNQFNNLNDL